MDFKFENDRPIYLQIIEQIKLGIATGSYAPGDRLASVREMATQWNVNPNTMQRALSELEQEGLLQAQSTSGRYVTNDDSLISSVKHDLALGYTNTYTTKMDALGFSRSEIAEFIK